MTAVVVELPRKPAPVPLMKEQIEAAALRLLAERERRTMREMTQ